MDASDDFEVFATRSKPVPAAVGMVGEGPGTAATGGSVSTGARAAAVCAGGADVDDAADARDHGAGASRANEDAHSAATYNADGIGDGAIASNAPAMASQRRKRSRSKSGRPKAALDRRRAAALGATGE